jgi:hypothetical protein
MNTKVYGNIKIERISGTPYVRTITPFRFYSTILKRECEIPEDFFYDEESVPILKGTNPECGAIHDYLSREDSDPVCTKEVAAAVYLEFQEYYDSLEQGCLNAAWDWVRRRIKYRAVQVVPDSVYFHKLSVKASLEDIMRPS